MSTFSATAPASPLDAFAGTVLRAVPAPDPAVVTGRRVAVVGDPRQVVRAVPHLAGLASNLKVFQTEGVWVLPFDGRFGRLIDTLAGPVPPALRWRVVAAVASCNLRRSVRDSWTRRHLRPLVGSSAATVTRSGGYYSALRRSDVDLVGWPIAGVVPPGIRTADGVEHHVDIIVVA